MPWIKVLSEDEGDERFKAAYAEAKALSGGRVGNLPGVQSLIPEAMPGHAKLFRAIMYSHGELSRAEREMIAVVVSGLNGCHY